MINYSRRQLARYAVDEMLAHRQPAALAARLAAAMITSGKRKDVELLLSDIDQELEDRGLLARAKVTSAQKLSTKLKAEILEEVKKSAGVKRVTMIEQVDKSVIGGVKIETANHAWNKTIKRTLNAIKEAI